VGGLAAPGGGKEEFGHTEDSIPQASDYVRPGTRPDRRPTRMDSSVPLLLLPPESLPASHKPLSPEEQAKLARKFSEGRPLSELAIEGR
jgi:hypothetical protein